MAPGRGDTDLLLERFSIDLMKRGVRCSGTVQVNTERADGGPCDMDVKVLPSGPIIRISQSLGANARGCRLDPSALEDSVAQVASDLANGTDLLIINKFGKHEAEGRGFRDVIAQALATGIPVLVGVNSLNLAAFNVFTGDAGTRLVPSLQSLIDWFDREPDRVD